MYVTINGIIVSKTFYNWVVLLSYYYEMILH